MTGRQAQDIARNLLSEVMMMLSIVRRSSAIGKKSARTCRNRARDFSAVVLFDGVCNGCNGFVNFVIHRGSEEVFKFASLQSNIATTVFRDTEHTQVDLSTMVLVADERVYRYSDAVFETLGRLPGRVGWLARLAIRIPRPVRDFLYLWISRFRYSIWGTRKTCRLIAVEERYRFLE